MFASLNYYAIVLQLLCYSWQRLDVCVCAQFEIFVVKVGSTCENKTDLDEKRIFHYKLSKKLSEAHRNISIHCTTLKVELELDVSVCAQLIIFAHKNSFTWLNFTKKLCILGPITCHRFTSKGKIFCITGKSSRKTKNSVVMNLNVSANDINIFKV